jgi:hypothetical protein
MAVSGLRTWLHRIGYVTTVIVVAELGYLGYWEYGDWKERVLRVAASREETRTHEGPLGHGAVDILAQSLCRRAWAETADNYRLQYRSPEQFQTKCTGSIWRARCADGAFAVGAESTGLCGRDGGVRVWLFPPDA